MVNKELLIRYAQVFGVDVTPPLAEKFDIYARLLVEWNRKMNLTAITDPDGIAVKHFVDSLTAAALLPAEGFSLIDVGTGAGFPGVPLALWRPDCRLTLLDSLQKRLTFLEMLCRELALPVTLVHARAEEVGRQPRWREQFDVATARAVAALPTLCEYCLPYVKNGGRFVALKGPDGRRELAAAAGALEKLGGRAVDVRQLWLPAVSSPASSLSGEETIERVLLRIDKIRPTPAIYPRQSVKIIKQPL